MVIMPPVLDPFPHAPGSSLLYDVDGLALVSLGFLWLALAMISVGAFLDKVRWRRPVAG